MPLNFPGGASPFRLSELAWSQVLHVCVLAPHPDDFDAIGISLRHLHERGAKIWLAVLTSGASGVEDGYAGSFGEIDKARLREAEQGASCRFFGLPQENLCFLHLPLEAKDEAPPDAASVSCLRAYLNGIKPQLVFLPHGNDSNAAHRRSYRLLRLLAETDKLPLAALLNQDAKTIAMRHDCVMPFDEKAARWKAELLRLHASQQQRNLNTRGYGFDERVLQINRASAATLGLELPYAEVFELERFNLSA